MSNIHRNLPGRLLNRSVRSYLITGALRYLVKHRLGPDEVSAHKMRRFLEKHIEPRASYAKGVSISEQSISGIAAEWFVPDGGDSGNQILLYLHGGGFFMETPKTHGGFVSQIAAACGVTCVMPSYRLAPEHPFPAAVEDCISVYQALLDQGTNPENIIIAGDSAGGNLALVTMQQAIKKGLPMPACALLISPGNDLSGTESHTQNIDKDPLFNEHSLNLVINLYLQGDRELTEDERASPLKGNFEGLPPLLFIAGSTEIFRDCSVLAARRAKAADVDTTCHIWDGMPHCFPLLFTSGLPEAQHAFDDITNFINTHLKQEHSAENT